MLYESIEASAVQCLKSFKYGGKVILTMLIYSGILFGNIEASAVRWHLSMCGKFVNRMNGPVSGNATYCACAISWVEAQCHDKDFSNHCDYLTI